jgi:GT2 family glycosyltransferase
LERLFLNKVANITVAISTLDRPDALARCLDALWSGDVLPAEVVIVDQSRNDATRSMIEEHQSRYMPIGYFHQELCGLAASQNLAITKASYPVVAILDDDCVPEREWLATIEKGFAPSDELAALTGRVLPLGPEALGAYAVSSRESTLRREFKGKAVPWLVGSGNNFAVKREWFSNIGGCNERLGPGAAGRGGVDMDLFYRLLRAGARIRYEPRSLVYHERQSKAERISRRSNYGHGMGACCAFWVRQRDPYALYVLGHWLFFRTRLLVRAVWDRRWMSMYEELLMLAGTLTGLIHGLLVPKAA